ncbi:MAG: hypothetical protein HY420_03110 [Candidatus Kerfeldbacteria bacterium]|nr:hypothetical protein [Candidatus Kerfeldbacteria bacterium]
MAHPKYTNPSSDLGRNLTIDVGALALALPVVAREVFPFVIMPFVLAASVMLVVLFLTPFRDVVFFTSQSSHMLNTLRSLLLLVAITSTMLSGFRPVSPLSILWIIMTFVSVVVLAILTIDLRRVFVT